MNKVAAVIANPKTKGEFELKADGTQGPIPKLAEVTEEEDGNTQTAAAQEVTGDTSVTSPPSPSENELANNKLITQAPTKPLTFPLKHPMDGSLTLVGLAVVERCRKCCPLAPAPQETAFTISLP